jgi:hypothetical protein
MLVTGSIIKPRIFISISMSLRSKPLRDPRLPVSLHGPQ